VRATSALFGWNDRERLRRFLTAWESRLALDGEHVARVRARLEDGAGVSADEVPAEFVTLHSQVRVRDIKTGRVFEWTVYLPSIEEVAETARSPLSWTGATLLGRRVGEEFEWRSRSGSRRVRIESVMSQPKAAPESNRRSVKHACLATRRGNVRPNASNQCANTAEALQT